MVVPRSRKGDDRLSLSQRNRPRVQCAKRFGSLQLCHFCTFRAATGTGMSRPPRWVFSLTSKRSISGHSLSAFRSGRSSMSLRLVLLATCPRTRQPTLELRGRRLFV